MRPLIHTLYPLLLSTSCTGLTVDLLGDSSDPEAVRPQPETRRGPQSWTPGFPDQADLAILLDVLDSPVIDTRTTDLRGDKLFPEAWLHKVQAAYATTDVDDALQVENRYEEWRLVSIRVTPCGPIGIRPDQDIDTWCWPAARLVWQPVVEDLRSLWGTSMDFYADDRAVHAIYPVHPRNLDGERIDGAWREVVSEHLAAGRSPSTLDSRLVEGFKAVRDASATALLDATFKLRDPGIADHQYSDIDIRPELATDQITRSRFQERLRVFLSEFAPWQDLEEMTSFSLPEGRNPAGSDIWVFVGFDGNSGFPTLNDLTVIGRNTGQELVNIGPSQTVAMGVEDEAVESEIEHGNDALAQSVIISSADIENLGPDMADPYAFLVPNTSCASCHRLNGLRFDFHSLSGFEDRGITVSPRVDKDVARDLFWTRSRLGN